MPIQIFSPDEVKASSVFPVGGYQQEEQMYRELYSNHVHFYNVPLGNTLRELGDAYKLYAKTTFTSLRLILQYQDSYRSDNLHQISIDHELIKSVKVGSWHQIFNVSVEVEAPVGTHSFYWSFVRPHFNAALIWWHWFFSVIFRQRDVDSASLLFYQQSCALMSTCGSISVPDDFRESLISEGYDIPDIEQNIGLRLIDNCSPHVDCTVLRRRWDSSLRSTKPAEVAGIENQVSTDCEKMKLYSVSNLCTFTGQSFESVLYAAKSIGKKPPFNHFDADQVCTYLTGSGIDVLEANSTSPSPIVSKSSQSTEASSACIYSETQSGELPKLIPSKAEIPAGLQYVPEGVEGLKFCLANSNTAIQSFFNVLSVVGLAGNEVYLNDDSMLVMPFDESLYCQIVKENHKYALAELYDQRADVAEERGQRFRRWGILGGIFLINPLVPFMAYSQGRASAPRGSRLEELIPDPQLQFLQDRNSFLAMTHAGGAMPRLRRMIFHKVDGPDGTYYRIIPAVITHDSVIPCQVFSFNSSCFLRPVSAGIESNQGNYEARRIHRQYYHPRVGGASTDTGERILIKGKDIDDQRFKVFEFSSDTRDLTYFYVDYPADPSHVF